MRTAKEVCVCSSVKSSRLTRADSTCQQSERKLSPMLSLQTSGKHAPGQLTWLKSAVAVAVALSLLGWLARLLDRLVIGAAWLVEAKALEWHLTSDTGVWQSCKGGMAAAQRDLTLDQGWDQLFAPTRTRA